MSSLYIIIPAYNESENIENTINEWYPIVESHNEEGSSRLVIINDGSKDNTYDLTCEMAKTRPLLVPLTKSNGGHGSTVLYGYRYALQNHADYIFQTDSDGQTNPGEFEPFWEKRNSYDAVIGNRRERGDGKSRKFVENTVCFLLRLVFGVRIPDANAPFRLMRAELVARYIGKLPENYNLPNIMFTTYFVHYKEKVVFLPISFQPRQAGTNSLNLKKIAKIGIKAVRDFYMLKKDM